MKTILKNIALIALFASFGFIACQKQEMTQPISENTAKRIDTVSVKNGMLNFSSVQVAMNTSRDLDQMSDTELNDWYQKIGFVSLRDKINEAIDATAKSTSEEEFKQLMKQHSKYLMLNENNEVCSYYKYNTYNLIANEDAYFMVNGALHYIDGGRIIVALDGKKSSIENYLKNQKKKSSKKIQILNFTKPRTNLKYEYTLYKSAEKTGGPKYQRKLKLEIRSYLKTFVDYDGFILHQQAVDITCRGYIKHWRWGSWNSYQTTYTLGYTKIGVACGEYWDQSSIKPTGRSSWYYDESSFYYPLELETTELYSKTWTYSFGDLMYDSDFSASQFNFTEVNATSRGIGNSWLQLKAGW